MEGNSGQKRSWKRKSRINRCRLRKNKEVRGVVKESEKKKKQQQEEKKKI